MMTVLRDSQRRRVRACTPTVQGTAVVCNIWEEEALKCKYLLYAYTRAIKQPCRLANAEGVHRLSILDV